VRPRARLDGSADRRIVLHDQDNCHAKMLPGLSLIKEFLRAAEVGHRLFAGALILSKEFSPKNHVGDVEKPPPGRGLAGADLTVRRC
jgi:hypothetical protein